MVVTCPSCGSKMKAADEAVAAGATVACPVCEHKFALKAEDAAPAPDSPSPPSPARAKPAPPSAKPSKAPRPKPAAPPAPQPAREARPKRKPEPRSAPSPESRPAPVTVRSGSTATNSPEGPRPMKLIQAIAYVLLLVGLVLVVGARGMDSLAAAQSARLTAKLSLAQAEFNQEYAGKTVGLEAELRKLATDLSAAEADARQGLIDQQSAKRTELQDINQEKADKQAELDAGEWRELRDEAENAKHTAVMRGYWHDVGFVGGTVVLTLGLVVVGFFGRGGERWVCLVMIAIITFSLYIGGMAWTGSLLP